jgi:transposase
VITLPSSVRIYLAAGAIDLRKSIDGLGAVVSERSHDLYSGHLYVFTSRRGEVRRLDAAPSPRQTVRAPRHPDVALDADRSVPRHRREARAVVEAVGAARIPLDNNAAESALRIVALGRKNFLFVATPSAVRTSPASTR